MTLLSNLFSMSPAIGAGLLLTACASGPAKLAAQDVLLDGIAPKHVSLYINENTRVATDEVCQRFYDNTVTFVGTPMKTGSENILETMFIAALAGGATYGVGALGITNAFAALSLAASTNQVVYEGGKAALEGRDGVKTDLSPEIEIADAAMRLGCPNPSYAALKLAKIEAKENQKAARRLAKIRKTEPQLAAAKVPVCRVETDSC